LRPTGVDIVDHVVGGLVPGLPLVLSGASGTGRTVLALQLAAASLDNGGVVAYLCNEPCPFLLQQASTLGLELELAAERGQLLLLELDPSVAGVVRAAGMAALVDAVREEEPLVSTLVVDPFTALTAEMHEEPALRKAARDFVRSASPMSLVLTAESEALALQKGLDRILAEVAGASLSLHRDEASGRRHLRVEKSRTGPQAAEAVDFAVGAGGLERREAPVPEAAGTPAPRPELPAAAPAEPEEKRRPVVLVVDDDRLSRAMLSKWLEADYEVVTARDGFEAMTRLVSCRPDLVVLDLVMPRVTGYELLAALQRVAESLPLLVISGRLVRPADRLSPLVLGATDLLAKPVDRFELLHKVDTLLRLEGRPRQWLEPGEAEALFADVAPTRQLDADAFRERLERACRLGERAGVPSSLVGLAAPSAKALDAFLETADRELRFEDAVLRVSRRRAALLLVATEPADADPVLDRLTGAAGPAAGRLERRLHAARPLPADFDWHGLFRTGARSRPQGGDGAP